MFRSVVAGAVAGALAVSVAAVPALAKKPDNPGNKSKVKGTTSVMFTKSVKRKLNAKDITFAAVAPAKKRGSVKVVFPATLPDAQFITHTGGLTFSHVDASLTLSDFVFDLDAKNVDVTVPGVGQVGDALVLSKVKVNRKLVTANLSVAEGKAELLNGALQTDMFSDGMFLAKSSTKR